jgi:hypothetical protein
MKGSVSRPGIKAVVLLLAMLSLVKAATATTSILLTDEQLIASSRIIILGEVRSVKAQWDLNHENINTYVKLHVSNVLKGHLEDALIVFKQLGGTVADNSTVIFGAPRYAVGQSVLLFLDTAPDGTLRIAHLFQGKYDVVEAQDGQLRVERKIDESVNILGKREGPDITNSASLARFTRKIKRVLRDKADEVAVYSATRDIGPIVETPPEYSDNDASQSGDVTAQYTFLGSGYRWFEPDSGQPVGYRLNQTAAPIAGGGVTEINQALAAWTNVQTTSLVLQNAGSTTAFGFQQDGVSAISFNDPLGQMSLPVGCSGTLAIGGVSSAGSQTTVIGGKTFNRVFEGDVVFNKDFQCFLGISANLAEVATHEIGHSIGFDHSADPNAIMYATAHGNGRGATLGSDDIAGVSFLYPGSKTPTPTLQGFHDGAGCNTISGWAWDPNNPNGSVNVDIYDGSTLIGTTTANMYREDLLNALGSPNHGFSFNTPASLRNGAAHTINVKFAGTSTALTNTGRTVQCSLPPSYNGRHDGQGCNTIEGWAWNANDPNGTVNVDLYDGTTLIGTVAATLYRQDLADALGSPYHGWIFHTPASLRDGGPHTITAKFGGTNQNLPLNTPRTTSCTSGTPNYAGNLDVADCNFISGYAWDSNDNEGTINVAIYVDGSFLVAVPAQEAYPGIGSGYHGFKFAVPASLKNGQPHSINVKFSGTSISLSNTPKTITCP